MKNGFDSTAMQDHMPLGEETLGHPRTQISYYSMKAKQKPILITKHNYVSILYCALLQTWPGNHEEFRPDFDNDSCNNVGLARVVFGCVT